MERHFYTLVNYQQDNWPGKLAIAKFTANNNKSNFTKLFLFFATKGFYLYMSFDKVEPSNASSCKQIFNTKTLGISGNMQTTLEFVQKALVAAQKS